MSSRAMRAPFKLLPAERVLAAFLAYAVARLIAAGDFTLNQRSMPRLDFVIVFLLVLVIRALVSYRREPWPPPCAAARRIHLLFLGLFLACLPLVLPRPPSLRPAAWGREGSWEGALPDVFLSFYGWTQTVLFVVTPFALYWLASAHHIKLHGRLDTVAMVRGGWRAAIGTLRDWLPIMALLYAYGLMGPVIGRGLFGDQDAALARIDRALFFGHDPRWLCQAVISRPLSEWLSACYVFYVPLFPIVLLPVFAKRDPAPFRELGFALTLTLATGYVLYTVVPAQGPLFVDHFDVNLDAYVGASLREQLMDRTRVPRDCFPSLHTGASLTLLWGAFRHVRPLFWVLAPVVGCIPIACVYLRYHYVIDVVAGAALAAGVAAVATRSPRLQEAFHRQDG